MKERHWISLVTSIRHGQSVLVLGPEIPAGLASGAPAGDGSFVDALTAELASELEEDNRRVTGSTWPRSPSNTRTPKASVQRPPGDGGAILQVAEIRPLGRPCRARIPALQPDPDDLPGRSAARALKAAGKEPIVQRYHLRGDKRDNPEFMLPASPQTPVVYHLFGDAQEPGSLVLSENDLLDFLVAIVSERPPLPNSLVRALKRTGQSFLFVGFGIRHWYLRVLLKVLVRALELHRTGSAIATEPLRGLSEVDREQTILFYQRGTRIELEDADIGTFLAELAGSGSRRKAVSSTRPFRIGPRPRVFISYAREDGDLAAMVFDVLQKSSFEPWLDRESLARRRPVERAHPGRARGHGLHARPLHAGAVPEDGQLRQQGDHAGSAPGARTCADPS